MKLVRESLQPLFEIGEANVKSYKLSYKGIIKEWEGADVSDWNMKAYEFLTEDNDKYEVTFLPTGTTQVIDGKVFNVRVDFKVKGQKQPLTINKGRIFKVLTTVCNAIKDYLKRNPQTFSLVIIPSKSEAGKETRFNLYSKYIESQIPSGWRISILDNPTPSDSHESSRIFQLIDDQKYAEYSAIKNKE